MAMSDVVKYNNVDLSSLTGVSINGSNYNDMPTRIVTNYPIARTEGRKQIAAFFDDRQIAVFGQIIATDQPTFETNRATLMQNLVGQDLPLDIIIGGTVQLRFYATVLSVIFSNPSSGSVDTDVVGGVAQFTITFECSSPFGIDPNLQTGLATVAITTATSTKSLGTIQGTYKTAPYISVYLTSGTGLGLTANYIKLTNPATGKYIQITRATAVGELLTVDVYNKLVQVNRVAVDYSGNLDLFWDIGAGGTIQYDDNLTTRSINLTFQYFPRFL